MDNTFTIQINGKKVKCEGKVKLLDLIEENKSNYLYAIVNNRLRELTYEVFYDADVELLKKGDNHTNKIYESSLRYIIAYACSRVFPNIDIKFSYNVSRSIYLTFKNTDSNNFKITPTLLEKLKEEIDNIIAHDYPITRKVVSNEEAKSIYLERNLLDKIDIIQYRPEKTVHLYECNGYLNYMYNHMIPSTGHITEYSLRLYGNGIIIQYPRSEEKGQIPTFKDAPVFGKTLKESYIWAKLVNTDDVASINGYAKNDGPIDFINMCEQHHNNMLAELGNKISSDAENIKLICIAGPSSSGKTTFANRLRVELMSKGLRPIRISLDDYYKERKDVPLDEDGNPDLECLEALDIDHINEDLYKLINGEEVTLPHFDFKLGYQVKGKTLKLRENQPLIIEGIHALNDRLTS